MFRDDLVDIEEIHSFNTDSGRGYETPDGHRYPSVTTVLGRRPEKLKSLMAWRKRVGEEQANKISTQASRRGTKVHTLMENYIMHGQEPDKKEMPTSLLAFKSLRRVIDANLEVVRGAEIGLYSHELKLAGRCDLVGQWSGKNAIIDFKTSRKLKKEEWIEDYFVQLAAYAMAHNYTYQTKIQQGVVLMCSKDGYFQKFEVSDEEFRQYKYKWLGRISKYYDSLE